MRKPSVFDAPSPADNLIRLSNQNLAAALLAGDWAAFVAVEGTKSRAVFVLENRHPTHDLEMLERLYSNGLLPRVNPRHLFDARAFLFGEVARMGVSDAH